MGLLCSQFQYEASVERCSTSKPCFNASVVANLVSVDQPMIIPLPFLTFLLGVLYHVEDGPCTTSNLVVTPLYTAVLLVLWNWSGLLWEWLLCWLGSSGINAEYGSFKESCFWVVIRKSHKKLQCLIESGSPEKPSDLNIFHASTEDTAVWFLDRFFHIVFEVS
eukprot:TRINITY_DN873_c0_g1_i17.p1 TRINITY_DN873_c0_g1~~TRINITY_DN873_c0_g1_i17.p1  ORF type:complete len:164 (-),score=28.42 TRINITY_DN873_c0_g1_i17:471-962(-)